MLRSMVPWRERFPLTFSRWGGEMEDLMERFLEQGGNAWEIGKFMPKVNLAETDKLYEVTVELPGMKPEEVSVELREGQLWIIGEKLEEKEEKGKAFHLIERRSGEFRRVIPLNLPVVEGKVDAVFENGILMVRIPKSEQVVPKKIKVKVN